MRGSSDVSPSRRRQSSVIAFKPRQVILLEQQLRNPLASTSMARSMADKPVQLKSEDDYAVVCSVAMWLASKGFSKVLKRLLTATQIQDDDWKAKALDLNEVFSKYLETCNNVREELGLKKQEGKLVAAAETNGNSMSSDGIESKNKKRTKGHDDEKSKSLKGSDDVKDFETVDQSTKKQKDKKKRKDNLTSESLDLDKKQTDVVPEVAESKHKDSLGEAAENGVEESKKASKKKRGKVKSVSLDSDEKKSDIVPEVAESKKDSLVEAAENGITESKKASKKRKRKDAEEEDNQFSQDGRVEDSKPKNAKGLEEGKDVVENVQAGQEGSQNVSGKQTDESTKVALRDNGIDESGSKSAKKQRKSYAEPKRVNAFQRVKIDEVKFADERLQDNSYWAKDGAETGYGAKAQEVLGQVKGRDFRHEKTKKKRGSYRGGLIDLQSHSIKFNYSDEE